jgi:hypothetical protein
MGKSCWLLGLGLVACSASNTDGHGAAGNGAASGGSVGNGAASGASRAGNGSAGASSSNGGTSNGGTSSSAAGASGGGESNTFTATVVNAPNQMRGELTIEQYSADNVSFETNVDIYFTYVREEWDGCTRYQLGNCGYYDCPAGSNPIGADNGAPIYYDGGTATITGLPPAVVAPFDSGNGQLFARPPQQLWPIAGGMVSIAITGGSTVPAFTMQLPTPPMVRLLTVNGEATPTSITRSDGIHLTWASSGAGTAAFFIYAASGEHPAAVCQFDASANAGDLPAAVLTHVDPGAMYYLEFRGQTTADVQVGTWDMAGYAYSFGHALEGSVTTAVPLE